MSIINNFLNKRYSTRNLTDAEFDGILPVLAEELSTVNFIPSYTEQELRRDWVNLCAWNSSGNRINSTSRIGMKTSFLTFGILKITEVIRLENFGVIPSSWKRLSDGTETLIQLHTFQN